MFHVATESNWVVNPPQPDGGLICQVNGEEQWPVRSSMERNHL